jgi:hypothetical protein
MPGSTVVIMRAENSGMSECEPFFCVVRGSEREWIVEARWLDGVTEIVEIFADYVEALQWLSMQSSVWLEQRMANEKAG